MNLCWKKRLTSPYVTIPILIFVCLLFGFSLGYRTSISRTVEEAPKVRPYYITMDDTGAWLGDSPGHKFFPLYDAQGNRLGGKLNNDSAASPE